MICSLRRYEWEALANLLGQGYAFQSAYCMIQSDENVIRKLRQGMPLTDLLTQGHHGLFYDHLRFFLQITGVGDAIHASLAMADFLMKLRRTLFQQASYPLLLLCFSCGTVFIQRLCFASVNAEFFTDRNERIYATSHNDALVGICNYPNGFISFWFVVVGKICT